ncbi:MAG TPA: hypothetical protein VFN85_06190 [Solirubrobacterales bacterium]|nr:hypothetical protein [Solirubrobacterales bacterium]
MTLGPRRLFLRWTLALLAVALVGPLASGASAAPIIALHMDTPETTEPVEAAIIKVNVENVGDESFSSPLTIENTFPEGVTPVEGTFWASVYEGTGYYNLPIFNCSVVAQTSTCTVYPENPVTGEGLLPGNSFTIKYQPLHFEPDAGPTLHDLVSVEGGGAFEPVSREETMYVGPPKPFGFRELSAALTNKDGSNAVQAGSSPGSITTSFSITSQSLSAYQAFPTNAATEPFRNTIAHVPPGVIGNPNVTPEKCTALQLTESAIGVETGLCPPDSQVGFVRLFTETTQPLFNMVAPPGTPAMFGFNYRGVPVVLTAKLRPDYGLDIVNRNAVISLPLDGFESTFWGVPADSSHDTMRGSDCLNGAFGQTGKTCPTNAPPRAFLRLPTSCPGHQLAWEFETDSYLHPEAWSHATTSTPAPVGCNQLEFTPTLEARPTTNVGDAPSGLEFHLHLPQNDDPQGLAEANLKDTVVTLPPGLVLNPSSANGLGSCSPSQIGLTTAVGATPIRFTQEEAHCPDPSRLGSVEIDTPLVDHPLRGSIYLATPFDNPYHSLIALYYEVHDPQTGVVVKIPARIALDPSTGQVKTIAEEAPQLPFDDFRLNFDSGPHASLRTPAPCGTFTTPSVLTPWTTPEGANATPSDSFQIVKGADGGGCSASESQLPAKVSFSAGTLNPKGGAFSPFALKVVRADGTQPLRKIDTTLPPGLLGRLAGLPYCSEADIAAAAAKSGAAEQASPSCPAASRVGGVNVGSGAGPSPFYTSGNVYMAGPYKDAPLSLAFVVPVLAGPLDLGTVVTRTALYIDPETVQIHAVSDPLPTIIQGIPLDIRSIAVNLDRPSFTLNPTSCDPLTVSGTISSVFNQDIGVSNPFQVGGCQELGFKPKLRLELKGGTKRTQHPALRAVLRARPGDANISWAQVTLPHSEFLDQSHIRTICTRVQFAAHSCPANSVYGYAKAVSPLLSTPLEGPVYLRSSNHQLPDLVVALRGQFEVDVAAKIDTGKNNGLRSTFETVPDTPVSEFVLTMKGGKKGLFENSTDICRRKNKVGVLLEAHNGKTGDQRPVLKVRGCHKAKHHKHKSKKHK